MSIKNKILSIIRFYLFRCLDCGIKLRNSNNYGDVCQKCFDDFDGVTIEEIMDDNHVS